MYNNMVSVAWYTENQELYVSINIHEICTQPKQRDAFFVLFAMNKMIIAH